MILIYRDWVIVLTSKLLLSYSFSDIANKKPVAIKQQACIMIPADVSLTT